MVRKQPLRQGRIRLFYGNMKIQVDQELCIGAASCVAIAAKTFGLNTEGKAYILEENVEAISAIQSDKMDTRELIIEAARSCPVAAIRLFEDTGEEIIL